MSTASENTTDPNPTRRWPRYQAHLPILISVETDTSRQTVPGLASEISRSGMALYGGVQRQPGDLMEVEFQTPGKLRVMGVVRNRSGFCFGLEFLDLMTNDDAIATRLASGSASPESLPPASPGEKQDSWWRIWLRQHRGDVSVAISTMVLLLVFVGGGARADHPRPAQASIPPQPSLTLFDQVLVGLGLAVAPPAPPLVGNPNVQVWVDLHTALYYCSDSEQYGKTPDGRFTTQGEAQLDQFEPAARKQCE